MLILSPDSWTAVTRILQRTPNASVVPHPHPSVSRLPALVDLIVHLEDHDDIAGPRQHGHEAVLAGENGLMLPPGSCSLAVRL